MLFSNNLKQAINGRIFNRETYDLKLQTPKNLILNLAPQLKVKKSANRDQESMEQKYERMKTERDSAYIEAKQLEVDRDQLSFISTKYLDVSWDFGVALTILQVSLLLIPISLVTKKR